ncbi:FAD-dependent oxidoreductase [Streptomyces smaragdinus]|uniref:FAD-dependent oxidoreductase n=1 Tax=Streptomyces smaragdinus TaxID=2585196 RepID=UPI002B216098|nr:FAD-dependent monooxygenase [Streptomyces smaragdinus]
MIVDPVIIVGAGPVGLTLSLALAHSGVSTLVLDGETSSPATPSPARPARTAVLRAPTVAFLERLGCVVPGVPLTAWRAIRGKRVLREESYDGEQPPRHVAQQALVDELRHAVAACDLVTVVPGVRVDALEMERDAVSVHTRGKASASGSGAGAGAGSGSADDKGTWWRGSYVVGCDGARSVVRKLLDIRFAGRTAVERHAVAAIRTRLPWRSETVVSGVPSEVCARPLADGVWRFDWLLPSEAGLVTPQDVVRRVESTLTDWWHADAEALWYDLLDSGVHTVHHRLAQTFRRGRGLLAGDAAHLLGALGTQQLDEGLQDAENLAWKLAAAVHSGAPGALLDSYEAERRGVIRRRLRAADQALPLVRRRTGEWRRGQAVTLLADGHLGRGAVGGAAVYAAAPPVPSLTVGTALGAPVSDVAVTAPDGTATSLHASLGRSVVLLFVAPGTRVWDHRIWLKAGLMPALLRTVEELPVRASLVVAEEYPGAPAHAVLVIRPDGRLVAAVAGVDAAALRACVEPLG